MKIGIVGYGNLGKALEVCARNSKGIDKALIFSRRKVKGRYFETFPLAQIYDFKDALDVLLLAGGSKSELPSLTPSLALHFNVVDSFDTHAEIMNHLNTVDLAAKKSGRTAIVSCGWDPGLFSIFRAYMTACMPSACISSFWGPGVSQGHSEAVRKLEGVKMAVQYTVPYESAVLSSRLGEKTISANDGHKRICYVVADNAHHEKIEREIREMPEYFRGFETQINFISEEDFTKNHNRIFHEGRVVAVNEFHSLKSKAELELKMDSNPHFTAGIMLAFARAAHRLFKAGIFGAKLPVDIPPSYLFEERGDICEIL